MELEKLNKISEMSGDIIDLKKKRSALIAEKTIEMKNKSEKMKKQRLMQYKEKAKELDEKERNLCRKTNQLVDELVSTCDDTPFHKALIKILRNLKGTHYFMLFSLKSTQFMNMWQYLISWKIIPGNIP